VNIETVIDTIKETKNLDDINIERAKFSGAFDISPNEFLKYASNDLESTTTHKHINALSNAKRAIDSQIEGLLKLYGFYNQAKKEFWGFPKKLNSLSDIGIITPRILKKLNRQRNIMEHEFIKPNNEQVEDFVDIATLFIGSSDKYVFNYFSCCEAFLNNPDRGVYYELLPEKGISIYIFDYTGYDSEKDTGGKKFEKIFTPLDKNYKELLKSYQEIGEKQPF
jgi:hypothetical protein